MGGGRGCGISAAITGRRRPAIVRDESTRRVGRLLGRRDTGAKPLVAAISPIARRRETGATFSPEEWWALRAGGSSTTRHGQQQGQHISCFFSLSSFLSPSPGGGGSTMFILQTSTRIPHQPCHVPACFRDEPARDLQYLRASNGTRRVRRRASDRCAGTLALGPAIYGTRMSARTASANPRSCQVAFWRVRM